MSDRGGNNGAATVARGRRAAHSGGLPERDRHAEALLERASVAPKREWPMCKLVAGLAAAQRDRMTRRVGHASCGTQ
jgi:hypothetical protein